MSKKGLFNKIATIAFSVILAYTALTVPTSAVESLPTGDLCETMLSVNADDLTLISGGKGTASSTLKTQATINNTTVNVDAVGNAASLKSNGWYAGMWSNLSTYDLPSESVPSFIGTKAMLVERGDVAWGGDLANPASGPRIFPVYAGKTVSVGDRIKVTAYVYAKNIWTEWSAEGVMHSNQETPVDVRMWICKPWESTSNPGYNSSGTVADLTLNQKMKAGEWTTLELTYTVTSANSVVNTLYIDNKTDAGNPYPKQLYFAGYKVEKVVRAAGGSYTDAFGTQNIITVNADGFTKTAGGNGVNGEASTFKSNKVVDGTTINFDVVAGGPASNGVDWYPGNYCGIGVMSAVSTDGAPDLFGTDLLFADLNWTKWPGLLVNPASGPAITPFLGGNTVAVGDKIKVTAYVYAKDVYDKWATDQVLLADQKTPFDVRMWVNKPYASTTDTGYNNGGSVPELTLTKQMKADEWTTLELIYTVNSTNIVANQINIDCKQTSDNKPYPKALYLAGYKVEKILDASTDITGTVTLNFEDVTDDTKVIVAAYRGNMFKGCDIIDYVVGKTDYTFSIKNAADADTVKSYIWNMNEYQPAIQPFDLQKIQ